MAFAPGYYAKAKAKKGGWIVLAEHDDDFNIIEVKSAKAGRDIKADVWYGLENGKFVECGQ